jgi:hypothetical protein
VAGIYSTKPGVSATLRTSQDPRLAEEIPVAIVGIVPCKGMPIHRGDMRGTDASMRSGTVIGKALQNFSGALGKIEVLGYASGNSRILLRSICERLEAAPGRGCLLYPVGAANAGILVEC